MIPTDKKNGTVSLLIDNGKGKILLQLRDDKETIRYPNCWSTFGGAINEGETPLQAMQRELKEELDLELALDYVDTYYVDGDYPIHVFRALNESIDPDALTVLEGQKAALLTKEDVLRLPFAFNVDMIVLDYFSRYYP